MMDVLLLVCAVAAVAYAGAESAYTIGSEPISRVNSDHLPWTIVSKDAVCEDGEVRQINLYSGLGGQPVHIGVYRPTRASTCQFWLVQQHTWPTGFEPGYHEVSLTDEQILHMDAGDHFGMSWPNNGTIMYNTAAQWMFCEKEGVSELGEIASLYDMRHGARDYSIQLQFYPTNLSKAQDKGFTQKIFKLRSLTSSPPEDSDLLSTATRPSPPLSAAVHVTSCAWRCQLTAGCVSFRWNESIGGCQLLAFSYNHASSQPEQDWKLYACPFNN